MPFLEFFANGGSQAYIVRVSDTATAKWGTVALDGKITVTAASPGAWPNGLASSGYAIVTKQRTDDNTRFRLSVVRINQDGTGAPVEVFENLSGLAVRLPLRGQSPRE